MSKDIQFISLVDRLQVVGVTEVEGSLPRTIRVTARGGLRDVQRVDINGYKIDAFTVVSDRSMLVVPGDAFEETDVNDMSISLLSGRRTSREPARLTFGPTLRMRSASGVQKLVQQVVKGILSASGSNRFAPEEGGDLLNALGEALSPDAKSQVATIVAQAVSRTEENILAAQAGATNLPLSERLMKLSLQGVSFLEQEMEVLATIRIYTMAGSTVSIPLAL